MYFTYKSSNVSEFSLLVKSSLAGTDMKVFVNSSSPIDGLAFDYESNRLYFVHGLNGSIKYISLSDENVCLI